jgi:hypothetical protein
MSLLHACQMNDAANISGAASAGAAMANAKNRIGAKECARASIGRPPRIAPCA